MGNRKTIQGKQLFVIYSYYQLLVSLIEAAKNSEGENNFILWNQVNMFSEFYNTLKNFPFVSNIILLPHELNDFAKKGHSLKKYYNYFKYNVQWYEQFIDFNELDQLCDKSEINVFLLSNPLVLFLLKQYPENYYRFIEEGEMAYAQNRSSVINWVKRYVYGLPFDDKNNPQIKEIWAKFPDRIPITDRSKVFYYNSQEEFLQLKQEKIHAIVKAFNAEDILQLKVDNRSMIIITQPLSEDKLVTEQQKIELYKQVIREYGEGFQIFIKTHPREKTNYHTYFPDYQIISKSFPAELFNLFDITFSRGVTVFSSAIYNLQNIEEKIFLGIEWNNTIAENMNKRYKSV